MSEKCKDLLSMYWKFHSAVIIFIVYKKIFVNAAVQFPVTQRHTLTSQLLKSVAKLKALIHETATFKTTINSQS